MVVNGYGGLDELTVTGPNRISYLEENGRNHHIGMSDPTEPGLSYAPAWTICKGGDPERECGDFACGCWMARIKGPKRDIVLLNAGAAITTGGRGKLNRGRHCGRARQPRQWLAALQKLDASLIEFSQSFAA